ncbi:hypothetical protein [Dactylosporangium sp. NPDC048998]|uniref:hypothetical protein n=1 Tax=Dactylosporangium sp. NPDC048998 TaxID=3363976 RepID=UPI00371C9C19
MMSTWPGLIVQRGGNVFDKELFSERLAAQRERNAARPRWQKLLIVLVPFVLGVACYANLRVDDNASSSPKPAAVHSACGYVDERGLAALFDAPAPTLVEQPRVQTGGVTMYSCLIQSDPALRLRLDLGVHRGTVGPHDPLLVMALGNLVEYSVDGTDGVLSAAKRSNGTMYSIRLSGSSGTPAEPLTQERLQALAMSITSKL